MSSVSFHFISLSPWTLTQHTSLSLRKDVGRNVNDYSYVSSCERRGYVGGGVMWEKGMCGRRRCMGEGDVWEEGLCRRRGCAGGGVMWEEGLCGRRGSVWVGVVWESSGIWERVRFQGPWLNQPPPPPPPPHTHTTIHYVGYTFKCMGTE